MYFILLIKLYVKILYTLLIISLPLPLSSLTISSLSSPSPLSLSLFPCSIPYFTGGGVGVYDPTMHHGVPHMMHLSRTVLLTLIRWYVREHVGSHKGLYRFRPLECITPYFLLRLYIGISLVYTDYK
jgi:hypothetical protein